jgi:hypothetical protein
LVVLDPEWLRWEARGGGTCLELAEELDAELARLLALASRASRIVGVGSLEVG